MSKFEVELFAGLDIVMADKWTQDGAFVTFWNNNVPFMWFNAREIIYIKRLPDVEVDDTVKMPKIAYPLDRP